MGLNLREVHIMQNLKPIPNPTTPKIKLMETDLSVVHPEPVVKARTINFEVVGLNRKYIHRSSANLMGMYVGVFCAYVYSQTLGYRITFFCFSVS